MKPLKLMALFIVLLAAGCFGGGSSSAPPLPTPTLTPEPQPFRTRTTFVDGILSVDVRYHEGRTRTLDTVRDRDASWGLYLPRPLQPGHSSREWLLGENHYDGRILLYTVVSWNGEDPSDYLAAGWWLVYPPRRTHSCFRIRQARRLHRRPRTRPRQSARASALRHSHLLGRGGRPVHLQLRTRLG